MLDHAAFVQFYICAAQAVTTAIALEFGFAHPLFAVAICFTSIVMYDAAGVRKHAGDFEFLLRVYKLLFRLFSLVQ